MAKDGEIRNIAIVGTGVIGASWAAYYLSKGFSVIATDPAPNAEAGLRKYIDEAWKTLSKNGLSAGASRDRLTFEPNMAQALARADFVQENAPERRLQGEVIRGDGRRNTAELDPRLKLFGHHDGCNTVRVQASGAYRDRTSFQSASRHPAC